jgi:hypothetical protein
MPRDHAPREASRKADAERMWSSSAWGNKQWNTYQNSVISQ